MKNIFFASAKCILFFTSSILGLAVSVQVMKYLLSPIHNDSFLVLAYFALFVNMLYVRLHIDAISILFLLASFAFLLIKRLKTVSSQYIHEEKGE